MHDDDITARTSSTARAGHEVDTLVAVVSALSDKVSALEERIAACEPTGDEDEDAHDQPAPWVVFAPPAAAEDRQNSSDGNDPNGTLDTFVAWFNSTYVGLPGGPATLIPECWRAHPGLAMEVATLTYTWRRANLGRSANVRDAQYWHHQWRPGFAARMTEWVHPHCLDGRHRDTGAPARTDRCTHPTT